MSAKEQKINRDELSEKLSKIAELINKAEEIHEEFNEVPTTDFSKLYTITGVYDTEKGKASYDYLSLYDLFAELYVKFILTTMSTYAVKTKETEIEYINILLNEGHYIILEGEEDKVMIPHPSALASTHTHPNICLFSHKDIETADQLFIKGYIAVGVLTTNCFLLLYRRGVYIIDDRESLLLLAKNIKKSKTIEDLVKSYNNVKLNYLILRLVQFV
ncbi:hypothetical protein EWF20_09505 [Sulfolobus sp. S-194]|uniref:hypothetical protein n=1 Tax=Sulfolobus sp. S-194 TaxID=2512240 RepID=UPI001436D231|nr:hypothetical protein [Sulfolobus sp. S-194]QIW24362.1 hypothetical protein EWF20_09505 [Sulfolobus sp. S-194]